MQEVHFLLFNAFLTHNPFVAYFFTIIVSITFQEFPISFIQYTAIVKQ